MSGALATSQSAANAFARQAIVGAKHTVIGGAETLPPAQMAELVDALASGASGLTAVEVRVLSWAPFLGLYEPRAGAVPLSHSAI